MALTEFPAVSTKQRLRAARRLAAGDPLVLAAVYAGMTPEELDRLQFDPDFTDLIDACRALHALDHAAWRARIELLMRDSVEDALQENKVSTLNTLLRAADRAQGEADGEAWDEDDEADDAPEPALAPKPRIVSAPEADPRRAAAVWPAADPAATLPGAEEASPVAASAVAEAEAASSASPPAAPSAPRPGLTRPAARPAQDLGARAALDLQAPLAERRIDQARAASDGVPIATTLAKLAQGP